MPSEFFTKTALQFEQLLGAGWAESQDGHRYRVPQKGVAPALVQTMAYMNNQFGYNFVTGESPTLGKTYVVDPGATANFGEYTHPATAAFYDAIGQIDAKHHTIKDAANAMTHNAFLQELYHETGADKKFGEWRLGFNQTSFNNRRVTNSRAEALFLNSADALFFNDIDDRGVHDRPWQLSVNCANPQNVVQMNIRSNDAAAELLSSTRDKLYTALDICVHATSMPVLEARLKQITARKPAV